MKRKLSTGISVLFVIALFVIAITWTSVVFAHDGFEINWWAIENGGGSSTSSGGTFVLQGTIGAYDAGNQEEGEFGVQGGFWAQNIQAMLQYLISLPLVLR